MLPDLPALRSLFHRVTTPKTQPASTASNVKHLFASGRASDVQPLLRSTTQDRRPQAFETILAAADQAGWSIIERQKLIAYFEIASGNVKNAYERVMAQSLANTDYDLFITLLRYCYQHDLHEEGYALLEKFLPQSAEDLNETEFLAYAGYIAFIGGIQLDEALSYFDEALRRNLISPLLLINAYPIYVEAGREDSVVQIRDLLLKHYSRDPEALQALGMVELARNNYREGFRLFEARYSNPEIARFVNGSLLNRPRWNGEPLEGRRLLVHGEQGLGDIVMMSRYLPLLTSLGGEIVMDSREAALPLLSYNFPKCEFLPSDLCKPIEAKFTVWTGIMSMPFHFGTTVDSVPSTRGYLTPPLEQQSYWSERIDAIAPDNIIKIGLAWSGNPALRSDRRRSIPPNKVITALQQYPNVLFFVLQTHLPDIDLPANLIDLSEELVTLADTSALIQKMDLVITVDTSIVHISGALGKRTWLLLPYRYEWRWGLAGEKNSWYDSVTVLRQASWGDWDGLLADVFSERLEKFIEVRTR